MDSKTEYSDFIDKKLTPIFYWPEWLTAVAGDDWQVEILKNKSNEIVAAIPYVIKKKLCFSILSDPQYTPFLGLIDYVNTPKAVSTYKHGYEISDWLCEFSKKFDEVNIRLRPGYLYWMPFRWQGFRFNPRITYKIKPSSQDELWNALDAKDRTHIRKAKDKLGVAVNDSNDTIQSFKLYQTVFDQKSKKSPMTFDLFNSINTTLESLNARVIKVATTPDGQVASMVYLIEDFQSVYLFLSGINPGLRHTSSLSLLIWESIVYASNKGKVFDFEGSILPEIEPFFRGFGGIQSQYFEIKKTHSKSLKFIRNFSSLFK